MGRVVCQWNSLVRYGLPKPCYRSRSDRQGGSIACEFLGLPCYRCVGCSSLPILRSGQPGDAGCLKHSSFVAKLSIWRNSYWILLHLKLPAWGSHGHSRRGSSILLHIYLIRVMYTYSRGSPRLQKCYLWQFYDHTSHSKELLGSSLWLGLGKKSVWP